MFTFCFGCFLMGPKSFGVATLFLLGCFLKMGPINGKTALYLCFGIFVSWGQKRKGHRFTHCLAFFHAAIEELDGHEELTGTTIFLFSLGFMGRERFAGTTLLLIALSCFVGP